LGEKRGGANIGAGASAGLGGGVKIGGGIGGGAGESSYFRDRKLHKIDLS
jgi:hypothetical protein